MLPEFEDKYIIGTDKQVLVCRTTLVDTLSGKLVNNLWIEFDSYPLLAKQFIVGLRNLADAIERASDA